MKVHGKILHQYLLSSSPVDKEGFIYKKGELNTSYQKRWFTLKGNLLFYRDRPADRDVLGVIVLEGCSVQLCESDEQFAFSLVFSEPGLRTYKFSAGDELSQEGWVKALLSAQHGFLRVLLTDLRQQYLEAAKAAGVEALDCFSVTAESMAHSQKSGSVFYTQSASGQPATSSNNLLQAPPTTNKTANKKSSKLWPMRHTNVTPGNATAPPLGEQSDLANDFSKLHEAYGKEVRDLIADWKKKRRGETIEGKFIDLG
ncbi:sesquipedalian-1-like [Xyrauchen texanus]|uniref:sesquipedalian-1-like n=1 Tax=Xyrauchen texanus TaxID=154827 RepID=UPI002241B57C|nr:sesquipedalian-1-like [Xyrauchen texanus]